MLSLSFKTLTSILHSPTAGLNFNNFIIRKCFFRNFSNKQSLPRTIEFQQQSLRCNLPWLRKYSSSRCTTFTSKDHSRLVNTFKNFFKIQSVFISKKAGLDMNRQVSVDTLIYSNNNDKFYKLLSYFGLAQMALLSYMSFSSIPQMSIPQDMLDKPDMPWWQALLYKPTQYKNAFSILCIVVGGLTLAMTLTYPRRAVKKMWLLKGGDQVKIVTFNVFGKNQKLQLSLDHICCMEARTGKGSFVTLKLKDKPFFYLMDKSGEFHQTSLFDFVIGLKRNV